MNAETFHRRIAARERAVAHGPHQHVGALRRQRNEIPESVVGRLGLRNLVVRLGLHRVDQVGKFVGVLDEEDWHIIADKIPHSFLSVEFHRKATNVARRIRRTARASDRREADEDRSLDLGVPEELRASEVGQVFVDLEHAVRSSAPRMNHALGDALMVEVRDLLAHQYIFEQRRPAHPGLQGILVVADADTLVGRQHVARRSRNRSKLGRLGRFLPRNNVLVEGRILPCRAGRRRSHRRRCGLLGHG